MKATRDPHETSGLIAGLAAFITWGLVTAILRGSQMSTGVALIEVYNLQ